MVAEPRPPRFTPELAGGCASVHAAPVRRGFHQAVLVRGCTPRRALAHPATPCGRLAPRRQFGAAASANGEPFTRTVARPHARHGGQSTSGTIVPITHTRSCRPKNQGRHPCAAALQFMSPGQRRRAAKAPTTRRRSRTRRPVQQEVGQEGRRRRLQRMKTTWGPAGGGAGPAVAKANEAMAAPAPGSERLAPPARRAERSRLPKAQRRLRRRFLGHRASAVLAA